MWELNDKESWAPKNWCSWAVVLEKTLQSPLDCKEIKPVSLKGNQPWVFIGRTDAEGEPPILWMRRTDSLEKTLIVGKIEGRRRRGWGWDGWMVSLSPWTRVWSSFRSWWWTGKPGVLPFMGSQRIRLDWATELNWTVVFFFFNYKNETGEFLVENHH